jgi:hypothetical protein
MKFPVAHIIKIEMALPEKHDRCSYKRAKRFAAYQLMSPLADLLVCAHRLEWSKVYAYKGCLQKQNMSLNIVDSVCIRKFLVGTRPNQGDG